MKIISTVMLMNLWEVIHKPLHFTEQCRRMCAGREAFRYIAIAKQYSHLKTTLIASITRDHHQANTFPFHWSSSSIQFLTNTLFITWIDLWVIPHCTLSTDTLTKCPSAVRQLMNVEIDFLYDFVCVCPLWMRKCIFH